MNTTLYLVFRTGHGRVHVPCHPKIDHGSCKSTLFWLTRVPVNRPELNGTLLGNSMKRVEPFLILVTFFFCKNTLRAVKRKRESAHYTHV